MARLALPLAARLLVDWLPPGWQLAWQPPGWSVLARLLATELLVSQLLLPDGADWLAQDWLQRLVVAAGALGLWQPVWVLAVSAAAARQFDQLMMF